MPQYVVDENPGLQSVSDLPEYWELFEDPEDPGKGVMINCILGWKCQRLNRAKWHAYGLFDSYNVAEPGSAGALDAAIKGAYTAGDPCAGLLLGAHHHRQRAGPVPAGGA